MDIALHQKETRSKGDIALSTDASFYEKIAWQDLLGASGRYKLFRAVDVAKSEDKDATATEFLVYDKTTKTFLTVSEFADDNRRGTRVSFSERENEDRVRLLENLASELEHKYQYLVESVLPYLDGSINDAGDMQSKRRAWSVNQPHQKDNTDLKRGDELLNWNDSSSTNFQRKAREAFHDSLRDHYDSRKDPGSPEERERAGVRNVHSKEVMDQMKRSPSGLARKKQGQFGSGATMGWRHADKMANKSPNSRARTQSGGSTGRRGGSSERTFTNLSPSKVAKLNFAKREFDDSMKQFRSNLKNPSTMPYVTTTTEPYNPNSAVA